MQEGFGLEAGSGSCIAHFRNDVTVSDSFDRVWSPIFSADGTKVAFGALKDREVWWKVMEVK